MGRYRLATIYPWLPILFFILIAPIFLLDLDRDTRVTVAVVIVLVFTAATELLAFLYLRCPFCRKPMLERDWRLMHMIPRKKCRRCKADLTEV